MSELSNPYGPELDDDPDFVQFLDTADGLFSAEAYLRSPDRIVLRDKDTRRLFVAYTNGTSCCLTAEDLAPLQRDFAFAKNMEWHVSSFYGAIWRRTPAAPRQARHLSPKFVEMIRALLNEHFLDGASLDLVQITSTSSEILWTLPKGAQLTCTLEGEHLRIASTVPAGDPDTVEGVLSRAHLRSILQGLRSVWGEEGPPVRYEYKFYDLVRRPTEGRWEMVHDYLGIGNRSTESMLTHAQSMHPMQRGAFSRMMQMSGLGAIRGADLEAEVCVGAHGNFSGPTLSAPRLKDVVDQEGAVEKIPHHRMPHVTSRNDNQSTEPKIGWIMDGRRKAQILYQDSTGERFLVTLVREGLRLKVAGTAWHSTMGFVWGSSFAAATRRKLNRSPAKVKWLLEHLVDTEEKPEEAATAPEPPPGPADPEPAELPTAPEEPTSSAVALQPEEGTNIMSNSNDVSRASKIVNEAKLNLSEAGIRIAARQLVKLVQEPLAATIAGPNADDTTRQKVGEFLRSDVGKLLIASAASALLQAVLISGKVGGAEQAVELLARELRVSVLADGGDMLADLVMDPLRAVLANMALPTPEAEPPQLPPATPSASEVVDAQGVTSVLRN